MKEKPNEQPAPMSGLAPGHGSPQTFCKMEEHVSLRPVKTDDLPIFFVHQLDPAATRLAAFPSRDREAFFTHWTTNILGNPAALSCAILVGDQVAGNIGAWTDAASHNRLVGYWLGREFWGRGIASAALSQFLRVESTRPLSAHVAKHNLGSIRVLEKAGFARAGEDAFALPNGARSEEFIYFLAA
jgi:RimJ/RimL family protein N-acetyltransferase